MTAAQLIWVSGASRGIGQALLRTLPWPQARVLDISRSGPGEVGIEHVAADLSSHEGWNAAAASFTLEAAGFDGERIAFVHCAGALAPIGFAAEVDLAAYTRTVLLDSAAPQVLGAAFLRAVAPLGIEAHLVMLTSGAARSVYPGWSAYGAGKAALDQWVRDVGAELDLRGSSCRVIAVAPGVVATEMQEQIRATSPHDFPQVDKFVDLHERGELRAPDDAARSIWRLLDTELPNGVVIDLRDVEPAARP